MRWGDQRYTKMKDRIFNAFHGGSVNDMYAVTRDLGQASVVPGETLEHWEARLNDANRRIHHVDPEMLALVDAIGKAMEE
jgi:hypothetical protein